jgi:hypothetical protein
MFYVLKAQKRRPAMKKISTMQVIGNEILKEQKLTIGLDLGDPGSKFLYGKLGKAGKRKGAKKGRKKGRKKGKKEKRETVSKQLSSTAESR